jgi:hypothetical protein
MREAVEAAERCADGTPWEDELQGYCRRLYGLPVDYGRRTGRNWFTDHTREGGVGVYFSVLKTTGAGRGALTVVPMLARSSGGPFIMPLTGARQPDLLRDILGNPFRDVASDPSWRTAAVTSMAERVYSDREFGVMSGLADALQDAGCGDAAVLEHCRGSGPHSRGRWVVDLVLGKT